MIGNMIPQAAIEIRLGSDEEMVFVQVRVPPAS